MSSLALQRVVVRMLFDPELVQAVYADPEDALAEVELNSRERNWLRQPDPRAWGTDRYRRSRGLQAVLEEFPCALAAGVGDGKALGRLDAFFSSQRFHRCIQERGSLALSFAAWCLQSAPEACFQTPLARALLRLESGIARLRRRPSSRPAQGSRLRLAAHVALLTLPGGSLDAYQRLCRELATRDPVAELLAGKRPGAGLSLLVQPDAEEQVLLEERDGQVGVELCNPGLAGLLRRAAEGCSRAQLCAAARALGAEPGEDLDVIADFVAQGLLEPVD